MQISLTGLIPDKTKREILNYAKFCCKELLIGPRVKILIVVSLHGHDLGNIAQLSQNKYEIWINKASSGRDLWETLGHEICHVWQFQSGRLTIKSDNLYFNGVCMTPIPYLEQPFEIEARKVGRELWGKWIKRDFRSKSKLDNSE